MASKKDVLVCGYIEHSKGIEIVYEVYVRPSKEIFWEAHLTLGGKKLHIPEGNTYDTVKYDVVRSIDNYAAELKWAKKAKRCILFNPSTFNIDTEFLMPVSKGYKTRNFSVLAYERVPGKHPLYTDQLSEDLGEVLIVPSEQSITSAYLSSLTDAVRASQDKLYEELVEKMK